MSGLGWVPLIASCLLPAVPPAPPGLPADAPERLLIAYTNDTRGYLDACG